MEYPRAMYWAAWVGLDFYRARLVEWFRIGLSRGRGERGKSGAISSASPKKIKSNVFYPRGE